MPDCSIFVKSTVQSNSSLVAFLCPGGWWGYRLCLIRPFWVWDVRIRFYLPGQFPWSFIGVPSLGDNSSFSMMSYGNSLHRCCFLLTSGMHGLSFCFIWPWRQLRADESVSFGKWHCIQTRYSTRLIALDYLLLICFVIVNRITDQRRKLQSHSAQTGSS